MLFPPFSESDCKYEYRKMEFKMYSFFFVTSVRERGLLYLGHHGEDTNGSDEKGRHWVSEILPPVLWTHFMFYLWPSCFQSSSLFSSHLYTFYFFVISPHLREEVNWFWIYFSKYLLCSNLWQKEAYENSSELSLFYWCSKNFFISLPAKLWGSVIIHQCARETRFV